MKQIFCLTKQNRTACRFKKNVANTKPKKITPSTVKNVKKRLKKKNNYTNFAKQKKSRLPMMFCCKIQTFDDDDGSNFSFLIITPKQKIHHL